MRVLAEQEVQVPASGQRSAEDERLLVAAAKALDERAWETLFHQHYDQLRTYVRYRVGDAAVADDLASQVFAEAVAGIGKYRYRGIPIRAWLFRIARNLSNDYVRKERYRPDAALQLREAPSPLRLLERDLEVRQLTAALERLTDEQRQVLVLRFILEHSVFETAETMSKSIGAVKTLQHRALAAARRALASIDPTSWGETS